MSDNRAVSVDRGMSDNRAVSVNRGMSDKRGLCFNKVLGDNRGVGSIKAVGDKREVKNNRIACDNRVVTFGIRKHHTVLHYDGLRNHHIPDTMSGVRPHFPDIDRRHRSQTEAQRAHLSSSPIRVKHLPPQRLTRTSSTPVTPQPRRKVRTAGHLMRDPRFTGLKQTLTSPDPTHYVDGFLALSDAGMDVMQRHSNSLMAWQKQRSQTTISGLVERAKSARRSHFKVDLNDSDTSLHFSSGSEDEDDGNDDAASKE